MPDYTRKVTCPSCGKPVTQTLSRCLHSGSPIWASETHDAPCGLPCFEGGISRADHKAGRYHHGTVRSNRRKGCDRCAPKEPHGQPTDTRRPGDATARR